jgi:hypothetical protein
MAIELTDATVSALQKIGIEPQIVLEIDGVTTVYGAATILEVIRIGDTDLEIGDDWVIGGFSAIDDQEDLIVLEGSSNEITQQLNPDRGAISSVSSMRIALADIGGLMTELISPGAVVDDLLGRRAKVWIGFAETSYPEDYIPIFKGIIDDIVSEQTQVVLNIAHPDQKKMQSIFTKASTQLNEVLDSSEATITVDDTSNFLAPSTGPDGANDTSLKFYIRIDDEIIRYTGISGSNFTGCTRGALGTTAAAHDDDTEVNSFYRLEGDGVTLALKIMLSGWAGYFETGVAVTNFLRINATDNVTDAIYFEGVDVEELYGLTIGDYITTVSATNGANNVTLKTISDIVVEDGNSYIVINGVTFVEEVGTAATISFRSQYDTLGEGLKMRPDEVDVEEHLRWYTLFLSSFNYDFYLKDTINGKEFIEKQIFLPMGAYSLPRKARSSMGFHSSPLPNGTIITLDETNILNPTQLKKRRTIGKNFYNTVVYRMEDDALEDRFLFGHVKTDATSKTQIPVGNKALIIDALGMRKDINAANLGESAATRLLNRYKFAAEFFENVNVLFSVGYNLECGDIVVFDGSELNISDAETGTRGAAARLYEIINKKLNIKTGAISLTLVDTNYATASRYGLISPASYVKSGSSQTSFVIEESFNSVYGSNEGRKWSRYIGCGVKVRNADGSVSGTALLTAVSGNTITVDSALGFTPANGYLMTLDVYNSQNAVVKLLYTFMRDSAFDDGEDQYLMI